MDAAELISRAGPAVVTVIGFNDKGEQTSQGSGFIVAADGVILTAWHVLVGATRVQVRLSIGAFCEVEGLLGWDEDVDFALLKVDGRGLPTVPVGDSDAVRQGHHVLTLGAPLGLEQTASEGIVSAVREWPQRGTVLQLTAPISPGSSGGPVLNEQGEAVGIVSFLVWQGQNLNFAVPINQVKPKLATRGTLTPLTGVPGATVHGEAAEPPTTEPGPPPEGGEVWNWDAWCECNESLGNTWTQLFLAGPELPKVEEQHLRGARERYEEGLRYFLQVAENLGRSAEARKIVGFCLSKLGRHREAADACKEAIHANPIEASQFGIWPMPHEELRYYQTEVVEPFRRESLSSPRSVEACFILGVAYHWVELYEEAAKTYGQAIRLAPEFAAAHAALGQTYISSNRFERAVDAYQQLIRVLPLSSEAYTRLSVAYTLLGRDPEATEAIDRARQLYRP